MIIANVTTVPHNGIMSPDDDSGCDDVIIINSCNVNCRWRSDDTNPQRYTRYTPWKIWGGGGGGGVAYSVCQVHSPVGC